RVNDWQPHCFYTFTNEYGGHGPVNSIRLCPCHSREKRSTIEVNCSCRWRGSRIETCHSNPGCPPLTFPTGAVSRAICSSAPASFCISGESDRARLRCCTSLLKAEALRCR